MMSKHTAGPWAIQASPTIGSYRVQSAAVVPGGLMHVASDMSLDNARLIVKAPQMLDLLRRAATGEYDADPITHANWLADVAHLLAEVEGA